MNYDPAKPGSDRTVLSAKTVRGCKHVYTLQPGEDYYVLEGVGIIISHPERPPFVIREDGRRENLLP